MLLEILSLLLIVLIALVMNAAMDAISHHYKTSFAAKAKESFWNPAISWKNKYELDKDGELILDEKGKPIRRMLVDFTLLSIPIKLRYPSALSDAWHGLKSLMLLFLIFAICLDAKDLSEFLIKFISTSLFWILIFDPIYKKLSFFFNKK